MMPTAAGSGADSLEPIERVVLFNDGTNQLLLSAFFNEEIRVVVQGQEEGPEYITRTSVLIRPDRRVVCYAETTVFKNGCSQEVLEKVRDRRTPLGSIIRSAHDRVEKKLISFGRSSDRFFRKYEIASDELRFIIREEFPISAFRVGAVET